MMKPTGYSIVLSLVLAFWTALAGGVVAQQAGLGLTGEVTDVLLPGSELRVKPDPQGRNPLAVRITATYPHGTAGFRYDMAWVAYEPGSHNLANYLERLDGSAVGELPSIPVQAVPVLPPGPPRPLAEFSAPLPKLGGYRTALITFGCLWVAGLVGLLCWRRQATIEAAPTEASELSLVERLRSLLDRARGGTLDADSRAELERLVLGFWRQRLDLAALSVPEAVRQLRAHPEAGGLLHQVEVWLHSGKSAISESDVAALLTPYLQPNAETAKSSVAAAPAGPTASSLP
ncbi:MAG: hypothetical protein ACKV19_18900 [Verrucomicrobiales bacterium]